MDGLGGRSGDILAEGFFADGLRTAGFFFATDFLTGFSPGFFAGFVAAGFARRWSVRAVTGVRAAAARATTSESAIALAANSG